MPLIIDGNNLLHVLMPRRFERLHVAGLCKVLARSPWRNQRMVVVCDGQPGPLGLLESPAHEVELLYSGFHRKADHVIHDMIQSSPSPQTWTVVTDDRQIQVEVRSHGAKVMGCVDFLARLDAWENQLATKPPSDEKQPHHNANLSEDEVQKWLREFGEN